VTAPTPPLVAFPDGSVPDSAALNGLGQNVGHLYDYLHGGWRIRRPMISVRTNKETRNPASSTTSPEVLTNTDTRILWDVADVNSDHMWTGIEGEVLRIHTPGVYHVGFQPSFIAAGATSGAILAARILRNEGSIYGPVWPHELAGLSVAVHYSPVQTGAGAAACVTTMLPLVGGDRLTFVATQNTGQTQVLDPAFGSTKAWAIWMGPLP
jgi:hypothetical protein